MVLKTILLLYLILIVAKFTEPTFFFGTPPTPQSCMDLSFAVLTSSVSFYGLRLQLARHVVFEGMTRSQIRVTLESQICYLINLLKYF